MNIQIEYLGMSIGNPYEKIVLTSHDFQTQKQIM